MEEAREKDGGMQLLGDSRSDSPGHCAKFGTYSCIEGTMKKIIVFNVIQVSEFHINHICSHLCELDLFSGVMLWFEKCKYNADL